MNRKYHNHKLQTNPWHHEEETQQSPDTRKTNEAKSETRSQGQSPLEVACDAPWSKNVSTQKRIPTSHKI